MGLLQHTNPCACARVYHHYTIIIREGDVAHEFSGVTIILCRGVWRTSAGCVHMILVYNHDCAQGGAAHGCQRR